MTKSDAMKAAETTELTAAELMTLRVVEDGEKFAPPSGSVWVADADPAARASLHARGLLEVSQNHAYLTDAGRLVVEATRARPSIAEAAFTKVIDTMLGRGYRIVPLENDPEIAALTMELAQAVSCGDRFKPTGDPKARAAAISALPVRHIDEVDLGDPTKRVAPGAKGELDGI